MQSSPLTPRRQFTYSLNGCTITDPYQWLEEETPEVHAWIAAQNQLTKEVLAPQHPAQYFSELKKAFESTAFFPPSKRGKHYFWEERKKGQDHLALYFSEGLQGTPHCLIDPNTQPSTNLDFWFVSPTGKYITYGLSQKGDEQSTMHVYSLELEKDIEHIKHTRHASVAWLADETGFYYTRHPAPGSVPAGDEQYYARVYLHKLNVDCAQDVLIFGKDRPKEDMIELSISLNGKILLITVQQHWHANELFMYAEEKITCLSESLHALASPVITDSQVFVCTNYQAPNFCIRAVPISQLPTQIISWPILVPESKPLEGINVSKDFLIARYLDNCSSEVLLFTHQGISKGQLALPLFSTCPGIKARAQEQEFFYAQVGFVTAKKIYSVDQGKTTVWRQTENIFNPEEYDISQQWANSKDKTRVPFFVVKPKKTQTPAPTILTGYGGYGVSVPPYYLAQIKPWLDQGGIFALANIRGGGEFGKTWHDQGTLSNKQNTFNDFIAVGEQLMKQGAASTLGIIGGSNGGLTVGACMTQRPDLFSAVVCQVPVLDMFRYPRFLIAARWVHEWGDPEQPDEFGWLKHWSPYHNVKQGIEYPPVLFTTSTHDTRVHPLHARKMTAILQQTNTCHPVLLRTQQDAGHGPGSGLTLMLQTQADVLAFFTAQLCEKKE